MIEEQFSVEESSIFTRVLQVIPDQGAHDRLEVAGAAFIVSGGRGLMSRENFSIREELAVELGRWWAARAVRSTPAGFPRTGR